MAPTISPECFRQLAVSADLIDTSIYEIQSSWAGPKEQKQVNYTL